MSLPRHSAALGGLGLVLCLTAHSLVGSVPAVGTNQWAVGPALIEARAGATATSLGDGNVLVTGGRGASGPLASAELLTSNGTAVTVAAMSVARAEHTAVVLGDTGNILVAGGTTVVATDEGLAEVVTGSVEVFDSAAAAWYPVGALSHPRAGATAVALPEGRIAIVGGHDASGPVLEIEVYDPAAGAFGPGGAISAPRDNAAVTATRDGHIVVVGGSVAGVAQATADIIDPLGGTVATVALTSPRTGASATTTVEDQVLITGGSDGTTPLATTEVLDPVTGNSASGATLSAARADHRAYLLPHNGGVLLVGGSDSSGPVVASELVIPWVNGAQALGPVADPRSKTAGAAGPQDGVFVVAGGSTAAGAASPSSDYFGFATVKTDKDDYAPGQFVTITGTGWQPGETVNLTLHEVATGAADTPLNAVAEEDGTFVNDFWAPNESHIGVRFYLTATGAGATAQTTFEDGVNNLSITSPTTASPQNINSASLPATVTISFNYSTNGSGGTIVANATISQGATSYAATQKTIARANGGGASETIDVTIPAGAPTGSYAVAVTVANPLGTGNPESNTATQSGAVAINDAIAPTVTVNQAAGQADPTSVSPVNFTVVFSESVSNFVNGDVSLSGTAGATTAAVTGSGTTYNVAVSGMTGNGTVIATIAAGVASDGAGNLNAASTSTDNTVTYDATAPTVTINQAVGQADPTNTSPINFTVVFSESVSNFATGDVSLSGTAGATTAAVTGSGTTYNVAVSGMTADGTVIATLAAGVASDAVGNLNTASTSTDNTVTYDATAPTATINQAVGQADPTNTSPINYTVVFSESVSNFATGDVSLSGTAGATTATVTGGGTTYNVSVSGMTGDGTVIAAIAAGVASDGTGNLNTASTSTDNTVTYDGTAPTVTINQAVGQSDPTSGATINFTVVFGESIADFATGDVTLSGTAGATTATVTGSGTTYSVAVSGMTGDGTVIASIGAGVAHDAANNSNTASTSTDNTVTYDVTPPSMTINQAVGQADPTNGATINFTVVFGESVADFATGDVTVGGTAGATTATVTGSGKTYNVAVSGMTVDGTVTASVAAGVAHDAASNPNTASTSTDNTVTYDVTPPTVTINQAVAQTDPTNSPTINFTVVFSEPVADFATGDVILAGTAGATTAAVTGTGATYNVAVSGMTLDGTVVASIAAGAAHDAASNPNNASTSTDNTVTYDGTAPEVTIDQAVGQADPTNTAPINFTVVFSEPVADFATGDVILSGTAGATSAIVSGSGTTYNVAVSGMTTDGTVIASIAAGVAQDAATNPNHASTSTDNTVTFDTTPPEVTINQALGQSDPTNASPINFTVVFSESVADFATGDVTLSGTAGATTATVTGSGTTYNVAVSGMAVDGTVIASIAAGVAHDAATNVNNASTSTDNTVTYDITPPEVTINQAVGQADPTNGATINFTVVFSEPVTDFATGDVSLAGTALATTAVVTGNGTTYNVAVSGMTVDGTVIASIAAGVAHDAATNANHASTSTDNTVTYDGTPPEVTINQAVGQVDPTNASPINFTVVFSESVADFATGDVTLSGTAGATTATVTGGGTTYNVAVSGMTGDGTVVASIAAGVAHDAATNANHASTSTDNTVTFDTIPPAVTVNQAAGQADPTNASPINFTVVFTESVADFATGDVTLGGTAGATTAVVTGSGTTYNVAVSGMTTDGTVVASVAAGVAHDAATNASTASTSTDNIVTFDTTPPHVTINQAVGQLDPTNSSPINFTVVFTEPVADFVTGDVTLTGTAGATTASVTGSGTTYNVAVSGMTADGTVIAAIGAGVAQDAATNANTASTSVDHTVTYDSTPPVITITAPTHGGAYALNQVVAADYSCTDATSGVATCAGPVADGANFDTSTVGSHSFTANATDLAGNAASKTHTYGINYVFNGFFSPVTNGGVWNVVNAGRAIPLKWTLTDAAGSFIFDLATVQSIYYFQVACSVGDSIPVPLEGYADDAGASDLRISGTEYHFNWKTAKNFANKCFELRVTLNDGTPPHIAKFKFTK